MATTEELLYRLSSVEDRLQGLKDEVDAIRRLVPAAAPVPSFSPPRVPEPSPVPAATSVPPIFSTTSAAREPFPSREPYPSKPAPAAPRPPRPPAPPREPFDLAALFGPKAFAWAGGIVTLLGILFFFALAVNRGWIGPVERVCFGAAASVVVFGCGIWLRRRFGETHSALAAVGAGIAGGYGTLAAATVLYHLVSAPLALVAATGIAAGAVAVAIAWRAELVAALGLVGAICAPALLAADRGIGAGGTAFALVVAAAAFAVAVRLRWHWLLAAAAVASAPQALVLVLQAERLDAAPIALGFLFALLYLVAAIASQRMLPTPAPFALGSLAFAALTAATLFGPFDSVATGTAVLVVAVLYSAFAVRTRWPWLLAAVAAVSAPQVAALVTQAQHLDAAAIALGFLFALLYLAVGVAEHRDDALEPLPAAFVLGSFAAASLTASELFGPAGGVAAGGALVVVAAVYGVLAVVLRRELGTLLGTLALGAGAVGVAEMFSGPTLAYTFAAEAAALALAGRRLRESRLQLGSLAYLVLAVGHALVFDAPPDSLFDVARHPASGAPVLAAVAVAAIVVAWSTGDGWRPSQERGVLRFIVPVTVALQGLQRELRLVAGAAAAVIAIDALSLSVLELFEWAWPSGGIVASFHRGEVALTGLWSLAGLVAVVLARRAPTPRLLAFAWLALTALKVAGYDATQLVGLGFSLSFVLVAVALLLAAVVREVFDAERTRPAAETVSAIVLAITFGLGAMAPLEGDREHGLAALAVAGVLGATAVALAGRPRLRELSTLLWAPALAIGACAAPLLVHGTWLVVTWAAAAAALAGLRTATGEERLQVASLGYLVLAFAGALDETPPSRLVVAHTHPAAGFVGLFAVTAAAIAFAFAAQESDGDRFARWLGERAEQWRRIALAAAATLLVYAVSLGILELAVRVSSASLHTDFQRGHTAVSALWGILGLTLLYTGLHRRRMALRVGGLVLFAVSLGKLFLYDLSQLSSVTRALSFLAVGAVLLLAGFFTQRLTAQP